MKNSRVFKNADDLKSSSSSQQNDGDAEQSGFDDYFNKFNKTYNGQRNLSHKVSK